MHIVTGIMHYYFYFEVQLKCNCLCPELYSYSPQSEMKEEFYIKEKKNCIRLSMWLHPCVSEHRHVTCVLSVKTRSVFYIKKEIVQGHSSMEKGISVRLRLHPYSVTQPGHFVSLLRRIHGHWTLAVISY